MAEKMDYLRKKAFDVRKSVLEMCIKAGTGHVTSSFSCVELIVALYHTGMLRYKASDPKWDGRDRFILSKGQASPLLYAILADAGFFPKEELDRFCQADGIFGVHLQNDVPGAEITAGSLGHGLGIAAGLALAAKMDKKPYRIFTLLGDGECHEGSVWETAMFASHHGLGNLIAIVDRNELCVMGRTEEIVRLSPIDKKWESFGWAAVTINGHDFKEILRVFDMACSKKRNKPFAIIAHTVKGRGIPFMENQPLWHGMAPKGKDAERARAELAKSGRESK